MQFNISTSKVIAPVKKLRTNWTLEGDNTGLHKPPDQHIFKEIIEDICSNINKYQYKADLSMSYAIIKSKQIDGEDGENVLVVCDADGVFHVGNDNISINDPSFYAKIRKLIWHYAENGGAGKFNDVAHYHSADIEQIFVKTMSKSLTDEIDKSIIDRFVK